MLLVTGLQRCAVGRFLPTGVGAVLGQHVDVLPVVVLVCRTCAWAGH